MSDEYTIIIVNDIDWAVYYDYFPGEEPITDRLPEDCHPGSPAEVEITGLYITGLYMYGNGQYDLVEAVSAETIEDIETAIYGVVYEKD